MHVSNTLKPAFLANTSLDARNALIAVHKARERFGGKMFSRATV
jgi:hypothetical protein